MWCSISRRTSHLLSDRRRIAEGIETLEADLVSPYSRSLDPAWAIILAVWPGWVPRDEGGKAG